MNVLLAGNGSYIVQPCGHDLHGPTVMVSHGMQLEGDQYLVDWIIFSVQKRQFNLLTK